MSISTFWSSAPNCPVLHPSPAGPLHPVGKEKLHSSVGEEFSPAIASSPGPWHLYPRSSSHNLPLLVTIIHSNHMLTHGKYHTLTLIFRAAITAVTTEETTATPHPGLNPAQAGLRTAHPPCLATASTTIPPGGTGSGSGTRTSAPTTKTAGPRLPAPLRLLRQPCMRQDLRVAGS